MLTYVTPCEGCASLTPPQWPRVAVCMLGAKHGQLPCTRAKRPEPPQNRPGSDLVLRMRGSG